MKQLHIAIESKTLANGLKVVIAPDSMAPVVTVGTLVVEKLASEPKAVPTELVATAQ